MSDLPLSWERQWRRIGRWYERFRLIDGGLVPEKPNDSTEYYEDEVLAFFQNCYHLKDWLKNDRRRVVSAKDVETYVTNSPNLTLCGALATGAKHLTIDDPRFDRKAKVSKRITTYAPTVTVGPRGVVPVEPSETMVGVIFGVEANGVTHDAFALATACVKEWELFLTSKGLYPIE